jgi:type IV pilus assembly protein PilN
MRLNINLASQPYEAARFYRRRVGALVLALAVLTVLLAGYIVYQRAQSRGINQQLAQVRGEIKGLDFEDAQARVLLNKPANRDIADQSEFLNQLFARKALSWTRVFTEMEKLVPPNLHVVSMKPEYTKTNDLMLRVVVATDSRDRAVELVRRMEKSNHFRQAQVMAEAVTSNSSDQSAGPGNIQFDIAAIYVPTAQDNDSAADESKPSEGKPSEKNGNPPTQSKAPVTALQAQPKAPVTASPTPGRNPAQAAGAGPAQAQNGPPKSSQVPGASRKQTLNGPPRSMPTRPH